MMNIEEAVMAIVRRELKPFQKELAALREGGPGEDRISIRVAAKLADRSPRTIEAWIRAGRLQGYGEPGERPFVSRKELMEQVARPRRAQEDTGPVTAEGEVARLLRKAQ